MKTRRMKLVLGIGLALVVGLAGFQWQAGAHAKSFCAAQGPGGGPPQGPPRGPGGPQGPGGEERLFRELNLTDAQKEQIKTLREKQHTDAETYHEQLRQTREQMRAAIESATFDEAAVRALAVKEGQAVTELSVIGARTEAAIYQVLTAEQRAKLATMREQRRPPRPE